MLATEKVGDGSESCEELSASENFYPRTRKKLGKSI